MWFGKQANDNVSYQVCELVIEWGSWWLGECVSF